MLTGKQRVYAIFKSLYFGFIPSWFYEKECHYAEDGESMNMKNYSNHLIMNIRIAKRLVMRTEPERTHDFHKMKVKKWFRWQHKG